MTQPTIIDIASRSGPRMAKKWMQSAIKRPGALTKKAKAAGETPMQFAREHAHSPGLTGEQSRAAMTMQHEHIPPKKDADAGKDRRSRMYRHPRSRSHRGEKD